MTSRISNFSVGSDSAVVPSISLNTPNMLTLVPSGLNNSHGQWTVEYVPTENYPQGLFYIYQSDKYLSVNHDGYVVTGPESNKQLWDFRTGNDPDKKEIFIQIKDTTKVWELETEGIYSGVIKLGERSTAEKDTQLWQVVQ